MYNNIIPFIYLKRGFATSKKEGGGEFKIVITVLTLCFFLTISFQV